MKVPVNRIIPSSIVDGPGNRTAVFLQGCNIDCRYCHNPETRNICDGCGKCVSSCPTDAISLKDGRIIYDREKCLLCDACIKTCEKSSSPRISCLTEDEVFDIVMKERPFIRGVSVSGGECTLYPEFLTRLFEKCHKEGLSTLIDSNGTLDFSLYPELLKVTDGVMLDIKSWTEADHLRTTGSKNSIILKNLKFLLERKKLYEVRTVVVPGLFDYEGTVREVSEFILKYGSDLRYKIIAFRPMGSRNDFAVPSSSEMERLKGIAEGLGLKNVITV